jgi:Uma2 family endonuclease
MSIGSSHRHGHVGAITRNESIRKVRIMASTQIHIGPADHGRKMTLEEFREAEEEPGYRYELARGVLEVTEVPNDPHRQVVSNLQGAFHLYHRDHPGRIRCIGGAGEFRLWIPEMISGRNPDVAVVLQGTPKDMRGRRPPSLVVEVVSPGAKARERDYQDKRQEYLVFGIREFWIVDPRFRQVTVLIRRDEPEGAAWSERVFRGDDVIEGAMLPGFVGTVAELWVDVEEDGDEGNGLG